MTAPEHAMNAAADSLDATADELTRLDALQGDGDLGRTAKLIAGALRQSSEESAGDAAGLLRATGVKIAAAAPSSSGTLIASAFLAAAKAVSGKNGEAVVVALRSGIEGIQHRGKARPGDRTMIDALAPALASLERYPEDYLAAAAAAEEGIEETRTMEAKFGRARFLARNAIGEPDPGAVMVGTALAAAFRAV